MFRALVCVLSVALAAQLRWTGDGPNNLFDEATNWSPVKRPDGGDDAVISGSFNVLLGAASVTQLNSLQLTGSVDLTVRSPLQIATQFNVQDTASFYLDAGNGFIQAGNASISSTTPQVVTTGSLLGSWTFQQNSAFAPNGTSVPVNVETLINYGKVSAAGHASLNVGNFLNYGTFTCNKGSFAATSGSNNGLIVLSNTCILGAFLFDSNPQGSIKIQGGYYQFTQQFSISNVEVSPDATVSIASNANYTAFQSTISNVLVNGKVLVGPGYGPSGQGVAVDGLQGTGSVYLTQLMTLSLNQVQFSGDIECSNAAGGLAINGTAILNTFSPYLCTFTVDGSLSIFSLNMSRTFVTTNSSGTILASNAILNDQTVIGTNVVLTVAKASTTEPGTVSVANGGKILVGNKGTWSIYNSTTLGLTAGGNKIPAVVQIDGNGQLIVADRTTVTANSLNVAGSGSFHLGTAAVLNFEAATFNVSRVRIEEQAQIISSDGALVNWDALICGGKNETVSGIGGCTNVCPARHTDDRYNFFVTCH